MVKTLQMKLEIDACAIGRSVVVVLTTIKTRTVAWIEQLEQRLADMDDPGVKSSISHGGEYFSI